jgi:hypothetical protein
VTDLRPTHRRRSPWSALLFALLMLLLGAAGFLGALVIGTMATDGCPSNVNDVPLLLWLFYQGRRVRSVLLGLFAPAGAYALSAIGYLIVLIRVCGVS